MNPGTDYANLWQQFRNQLRLHQQACLQISRSAHYLHEAGMFAFADNEVETALAERAKSVLYALLNMARRRFAPSYADTLEIDEKELEREFLDSLTGDWERFDPRAIWDRLESTYGGEKGRELAYRQYANQLRGFFGIQQKMPVRQDSGRVVLERSVYVDSFDKAYGKIRLSFHSSDALAEGLKALASFARWADDKDSAAGVEDYASRLSLARGQIVSREKLVLSRNIEIVTYQTRFEFRFDPALAGKLQLFISTYATLGEAA